MGTSGSYGGPTNSNALLPPWAIDAPASDVSAESIEDHTTPEITPPTLPPVEAIPANLPGISWRGPKSAISKIANGGSGSLNKAFKSYHRARGGSRLAAKTSVSGKATTVRLATFLSDVLKNGAKEAVQRLGLGEYIGRDAESLISIFIDLLSPPGARLEESIARKASIETISELFEKYKVDTDGILGLDSLDADGMKEVVVLSITNYINERFQNELVNCIERGAMSENDANQLSEQIKDFIEGNVILDLQDIDLMKFDWTDREGKTLINNLYETAYALLGDNE